MLIHEPVPLARLKIFRSYVLTIKMLSPQFMINILGWIGSVLYLLAYALVSLKKAEGDSVLYQGMNIIAGILLVVYSFSLGAYATTSLNAVWAGIGLFTLGRRWLTRNYRIPR